MTRWKIGNPRSGAFGSESDTADADGATIVRPAALYAGNELRASPEHDVPITPITALLAATPGAMFAATVPSHC